MEREGFGVHTARNGSVGEMIDRMEREGEAPTPSSSTPYELGRKCPKCGSLKVHRSRRSFWNRYVISILHFGERFFRCHRCQNQFWATTAIPLPKPVAPAQHEGGANGSASRKKRHTDPHSGPLERLDKWLYRKHGLSVQSAITLFIAFSVLIYLLFTVLADLTI